MNKMFYTPLILLPFIAIIYQNIAFSYPYYYAWDSSHIYATDILLVGSNMLPDHFFHPNMFPFVLYKWIFLPIGRLLGFISISSIQELQQSLNPYLAYVEFVEYILQICRFFIQLFFCFMYINSVKLFQILLSDQKQWFIASISIVFFSIAFLWSSTLGLHSIIRYETIGLALWAIALYFTISASEKSNNEKLYIVLAGFFAGTAFLSKILFIGGIIILPFIYYTLKATCHTSKEEDDKNTFLLSAGFTIIIGILNILLVAMVLFMKLQKTAFLNTLHLVYFIPTLAMLPLCLVFLTGITYLNWKKTISLPPVLKPYIHNFVLYTCSVITPLFTALSLGQGLHALLNTYIYSFALGQISMGLVTGANRPAPTLKSWSSLSMFVIISIGVIFVLVILYRKARRNNNLHFVYRSTLTLCVALLLNIVLIRGDADKASDKAIGYSWIIMSFLLLWRASLSLKQHAKTIWIVGCILVLLYSGNEINQITHQISSKKAIQSSYVYSYPEWKYSAYGYRGPNYTMLMNDRYPSEKSWNSAVYWSRNIRQVKQLLYQVQNNANGLLDSMILEKGSQLSLHSSEFITSISSSLTGALILPLTNTQSTVFLRADYDFYLISREPYQNIDQRIQEQKSEFSVNNTPYHIYHLTMSTWRELNNGYNGSIVINRNEKQKMFLAIIDRYAKGL